MRSFFSNLSLSLVICLVLFNCANRGTPSGGEKDVTPPEIEKSVPDNNSINFNAKEIKIYFDEYIKLNDLQKQLIISPPMEPAPEITPLGSASKYITIKILDTLQENTTYAINFGTSIVDNNEGNPYPYYRYVFSTGSYIDSLSIGGFVKNSFEREPDDFVSVMLYEVNETFNDSIIYKEKPKYITNTLDSVTTFKLENLKAGKYLMIALKEENGNYTFQQKTDKIAFKKEFITVPSDSIYELNLFKEIPDFKAVRPSLVSGNKIAFGYEGDAKKMTIELLSQAPSDFKTVITKETDKDTLNYWYKPNFEVDSLMFRVLNKGYEDTFKVNIRDLKKDTLIIKPIEARTLKLVEDFQLQGTTPFAAIDESKITILDKDSTNVAFSTKLDALNNIYNFSFDKTEDNAYSFKLLPGAFTDFFEDRNDTLNFNVRTKAEIDYGEIRVNLQNATYPVIVQLVDQRGEIEAEQYAEDASKPIDFLSLNPGNYFLRVIFDSNKNRKYDSGNYLKKLQPERVSHDTKEIEVRAFSEQIVTFILQ
ncbi:Ig-like domain-containing protein [Flavobacteriaceae bacterium S0825]|uniref:Ig-like domain-containing protein n=1 Tax=Gaetbulibacter sp. S0825 TaxID=2720084 RepID=UPI0014321BA6|nr:Ig-like domain-containing protein [Gaetbulibacter sp. S0825]MCK0108014.1 Ig-like domain-containing protein [Flavobacteriaceae bacterium S0825]NIX63650.1 Ig-like domain-containing protein [Gaetbulibacter sp. S0825]